MFALSSARRREMLDRYGMEVLSVAVLPLGGSEPGWTLAAISAVVEAAFGSERRISIQPLLRLPLHPSPLILTPTPAHFVPSPWAYVLAGWQVRVGRTHPSEGNSRRSAMPKARAQLGRPYHDRARGRLAHGTGPTGNRPSNRRARLNLSILAGGACQSMPARSVREKEMAVRATVTTGVTINHPSLDKTRDKTGPLPRVKHA